jgi:hypothetical protein
MKFKVGDKVRVKKDLVIDSSYGREDFVEEMKSFIGKIVTISKVIDEEYMILEDDGDYAWTEEMFEGFANEAPSIAKRINNKHDILNGLFNSDGSIDGEKLMKKLDLAVGDDYYEKSAMQPLEVSQVLLTKEQFAGALLFNIIKYRMRKKGQDESDAFKARQYAYWLEMVKQGKKINPSVDVVPDNYTFDLLSIKES